MLPDRDSAPLQAARKLGIAVVGDALFWQALTDALTAVEPKRSTRRNAPRSTAARVAEPVDYVTLRAAFFVVRRALAACDEYRRVCARMPAVRRVDLSAHTAFDHCMLPGLSSLHVTHLKAGPVGFKAVHTLAPGALKSTPALEPFTPDWRSHWRSVCHALPNLKSAELALEWPDTLTTFADDDTSTWMDALTGLEDLSLSIAPPMTHARPPPARLAALTALSRLHLTYGIEDLELECPFTAERALEFAALPALQHLSLTVINHCFEQAAADALAAATGLTALELLRKVPYVPMSFLDFYSGVRWLAPLTNLQRLKLNDARFICQSPGASWEPLGKLTHLRALLISGAHLNWHDYSCISKLTGLSELQLAHCSGTFALPRLLSMPDLERLYLKGNGAATTQMILLTGGAAALAAMTQLRDLYLGLVSFVDDDGHTPLPKPSVSELSGLTRLRALTITDSPFAMDAPPLRGGAQWPVAAALAALTQLTKLRIGHSPRMCALRGVSQRAHVGGDHDAVVALYSAVAALHLRDLTLDCHPLFSAAELQAIAGGNTALRTLRLMGASACTLRDLSHLRTLRALTRLVIGPRFIADSCLVAASIPSTFKRTLEGLAPAAGAALQVLQMAEPLKCAMLSYLVNCKRLSWLQFGVARATVWQGFLATASSPPEPAAGDVYWDVWPYDAPSDDDDYGKNVPSWFDNHQDAGEGSGSELSAWDTDDSALMGPFDDDDDQLYEIGEFYDPFNRRMYIDVDSDEELNDADQWNLPPEEGAPEVLSDEDDDGDDEDGADAASSVAGSGDEEHEDGNSVGSDEDGDDDDDDAEGRVWD